METLLRKLKELSGKKFTRRCFLKLCLAVAGMLAFGAGSWGQKSPPDFESGKFNGRRYKGKRGDHDLVALNGSDPYKLTFDAMEAIGGMGKFVSRGDVVVVKPNIGWDRRPDQAANTNPLVVAALVEMAFSAGAQKVKVFDITCNDPKRCYDNSGIRKAAEEKGATVFFPDTWNTVAAKFDYESPMEGWPILRDALECDTFINVPILKHHGLTGLTISMKNLMGVCGGNRGSMHSGIGRKLADLTYFIKPDLTVVDAYRLLLRHGPNGGTPVDVAYPKTMLVSHDPVLADAYSCQMIGVSWQTVSFLQQARVRNIGITDIKQADILDLRKKA